jgi:hypothetical protein
MCVCVMTRIVGDQLTGMVGLEEGEAGLAVRKVYGDEIAAERIALVADRRPWHLMDGRTQRVELAGGTSHSVLWL